MHWLKGIEGSGAAKSPNLSELQLNIILIKTHGETHLYIKIKIHI